VSAPVVEIIDVPHKKARQEINIRQAGDNDAEEQSFPARQREPPAGQKIYAYACK